MKDTASTTRSSPARASGRGAPRAARMWFAAARVAFVILALASVGTCVAAVPAALARYSSICRATSPGQCPDGQASSAAVHTLQAFGISLRVYGVYTVSTMLLSIVVYLLVAALIFWRRSDDWMGLFTATFLLTFGVGANGFINALSGRQPWAAPLINSIIAIGNVSIVVFFLVFPSGRFVPRWTMWIVLIWLIQVPGIFTSTAQLPQWMSGALFVGVLLLTIGAAIYRYRHVSSAIERQQTKWIVLGGVFIVGVNVGVSLGLLAIEGTSGSAYSILDVFSNTLYILAPLSIPISIGIAILRYRLFDIDLIIRRTLIYGSLTATLAAIYFGCVVGFQALAEALVGVRSVPAPVVVISTLLIAALFTPLRRGIQRVIDRRFYRSKYNAARTVEAFAATLRTETDLGELSEHLVAVVNETMRPAHVSLWLRSPELPTRLQPAAESQHAAQGGPR